VKDADDGQKLGRELKTYVNQRKAGAILEPIFVEQPEHPKDRPRATPSKDIDGRKRPHCLCPRTRFPGNAMLGLKRIYISLALSARHASAIPKLREKTCNSLQRSGAFLSKRTTNTGPTK